MSALDLKGNRVIVTGAAGGLGRAFALAFAEAGARVLACDVNLAGAEETAAMAGGVAARVDVTDARSARDCVAAAVAAFGGVDTLVNNAALYGTLERRNFEEIDEEVWDRVMAVNVKGVWQMSRAASAVMERGAIVNVASATVFSGSPQWMHYVASKGAVIAMSRVMAKELGPRGIRVNVLAPGFTMTEASLGLIEGARGYGVDRAAIKRAIETEDIVGGALWLASPMAGMMTGQTMVIDGGRQFI